ncbi:MAG: NAD-dependent epimerase/dehydratase family protein [Solirubrobacterales bacterium]
MKAFVTGGTGFIGSRLIRRLRERGDDVVALVRSPDKARDLREQGVELVEGDLSSEQAIRDGVQGCDAVFHIAAVYKVGIPASEREAMWDSNVRGTERVLDAATAAGVQRIVYVSTVAVFGNTHGEVVDESYARSGEDFLSCYDETKFRSHQVALDRIAKGAPIVIVQPGGVYGPGDHSELGNIIDQTRTGKLKMLMFPETGFNLVHVDDVADGIVRAHDQGKVGEAYVLGGEIARMRDLIEKVAEISGRKAPKRELPVAAMKLAIPIGPLVGKAMGFPPNLRELIRTSDGVTFWATDEKARRELGYAPRDIDTGLRETLAAP